MRKEYQGVNNSYSLGNVRDIPNEQTDEQVPEYEKEQVRVPVKVPVPVKRDVVAVNRFDAAFRAINGVAKKRNTQAEIKELAKILPVADLIWEMLDDW